MGVVYFIQAEMLGLIKIGYASNFASRFSAIRTHSPDALRVLGLIESPIPKALEAEIHLKFCAAHSHGEWFMPVNEVLAYIEEYASPWAESHRPPTLFEQQLFLAKLGPTFEEAVLGKLTDWRWRDEAESA